MAITGIEELKGKIELTDDELGWREEGDSTLPLLISGHIASMLSIPAIRRQFVPSAKENTDDIGTLDPQEERKHEGTARLIHRYGNRAAFLTTDRCFAYCRHCFRRRFTGTMTGPASDKEIEEAAAYAAAHAKIREILLTGGDMFTLSDEKIGRMLSIFKSACPDVILRLCTRAVATEPSRFTEGLFSIIRENQKGAPYYLMTQFNHPAELTEDAVEAVGRFVDMGIPAFNQSVLLKGVNDDAAVLKELSEKLLMARVKPYYLFQDDPVRGTAHFRVDIEDGLAIEKELRSELSGLAMPQYTADLPAGGGKVILTHGYYMGSEDEGGRKRYAFETPDGGIRHYPE